MNDTNYWKSRHLEEYNKENSTIHNEVTIQDKYGTLIMRPTGNEFKPLPGLMQKMINLAGTVVDVITSDSALLAPEHVVAWRLDTCKACKYYDERAFCRSCGCITRAKTKLSAARCPEGKWPSI